MPRIFPLCERLGFLNADARIVSLCWAMWCQPEKSETWALQRPCVLSPSDAIVWLSSRRKFQPRVLLCKATCPLNPECSMFLESWDDVHSRGAVEMPSFSAIIPLFWGKLWHCCFVIVMVAFQETWAEQSICCSFCCRAAAQGWEGMQALDICCLSNAILFNIIWKCSENVLLPVFVNDFVESWPRPDFLNGLPACFV